MTCSEELLLSRARYGVLQVLYIMLFLLFSFRTDTMCSTWLKCIHNWQELRQLTLNWARIKKLNRTQRNAIDDTRVHIL